MASKPELYSIDDFEAHAAEMLPKMVRDYFNGGAMDSITLRANQEEYRRFYIVPRVLRDVSNIDTTACVFPSGNKIPFPCCVAPAAMQRMAHPDGEEAMAKGCGAYGAVMGLSSFSTTSLEDVKYVADRARRDSGKLGESECVLQLYLFENRETSEGLIKRAEGEFSFMASNEQHPEYVINGTFCPLDQGYKAIVLTVDTPYFGRRLTEMRNRFKVPPHLKMANFSDALGVKTGSEHRTNELNSIASHPAQKSVENTKATPPNKNGKSRSRWHAISRPEVLKYRFRSNPYLGLH